MIPIMRARVLLGKAVCLGQGDSFRKFLNSPWLLLSYYSYSDAPRNKSKATPLQERRMIDQFRLHVKGGDGGNGCSSLRRSRNDQYGKPDGGNGGRGGDVILQCTSAVWDFRGLQHHINGKRGGHGASKNMVGTRGEDKVVRVPVGTVIHLVEGELPIMVEKPSSGHTNPWDVPGTVTSEFSASDIVTSSNLNEPKLDSMEDIVCDSSTRAIGTTSQSADTKPYSHASSYQFRFSPNFSSRETTYCEKEYLSDDHSEDDCISMERDAFNTEDDNNVSEEWEDELDEVKYNVAELTEEGQQLIVAQGGEGGLGSISTGRHSKKKSTDMNHQFKNCSDDENQPSIRVGLPGSQAFLILELKSIADVGLVGMPNAGKSTLLGAISRAKPAVGHYAFTTLRPNIGKLNYDEFSVTVADIPGLIKGAHANRGLGHAFLRHIERTKILAYVVDLAAGLNGQKGVPPWEQLRDLVFELEHYREGLSDRPSLVVANKIDEAGTEDILEELQRRVCGITIYPVCAVLEEGVPELKAGLRQLVDGGENGRLRLDGILID